MSMSSVEFKNPALTRTAEHAAVLGLGRLLSEAHPPPCSKPRRVRFLLAY